MRFELAFVSPSGAFAGAFYWEPMAASYLFCNSVGKAIFINKALLSGISIKDSILLWDTATRTLSGVAKGLTLSEYIGYYEVVFPDVAHFLEFENGRVEDDQVFKMLQYSKRG